MRIHLVGTVHSAKGMASAEALISIIEQLHPEVIFAEIPASHADSYRSGAHGNLESIAVARYCAKFPVAVLPVDLAEPNEAFFRDSEEMFGKVERTCAAYRQLVDLHAAETRERGFAYLNSTDCIKAWSAIHGEVLGALEWMGHSDSHKAYARWCRQNDLRDGAMLDAIESYASVSANARKARRVVRTQPFTHRPLHSATA
jgi:hypothetical protein